MWFSSWIRNRPVSPKRRPVRRYRPRLEALEDRCLMSAGALDITFNPTGTPPGIVTTAIDSVYTSWANAVAIQADGKIVALGRNISQKALEVVRYNGDGSLDTSFNGTGTVTTPMTTQNGAPVQPMDVAIQSDGKIVVCGRVYNSGYHYTMVRYTTTGALDQSFGQHGIVTSTYQYTSGDQSYAMVIQPDGKIVLAGLASSTSGGSGIGLARFNSDGSLDRSSFGKWGWTYTPYTVIQGNDQLEARDVAIDSAGRLVVEGFSGKGLFVARYTSAGSLDTSLGGTGIVTMPQFGSDPNHMYVALETNDKIVLSSGGGAVVRLNPDGSLDTASFGPLNPDGSHAGYVLNPGGHSPEAVQLESDGKIVVAAGTGNTPGDGAARLLSDGSLDPSFGSGGISQLESSVYGFALAIQPADGNIVVAGQGVIPNSPYGFGLVRFVGDTPAPPVAASGFEVWAPANVPAGSPFSVTVIATDASGNPAISYTGTVSLTSTSSTGIVTALGSYTFTAADKGAHTFSATLTMAGNQSLTATDANGLSGTDPSVVVYAAAASRFVFSSYPASVSAATPFSVTITVTDAYGNVVTNYTGTIHFTDSVSGATLPKDYTFTASDQGVHTFTGLILRKKGVHTLKVSDKSNGTIFGTISVDVV